MVIHGDNHFPGPTHPYHGYRHVSSFQVAVIPISCIISNVSLLNSNLTFLHWKQQRLLSASARVPPSHHHLVTSSLWLRPPRPRQRSRLRPSCSSGRWQTHPRPPSGRKMRTPPGAALRGCAKWWLFGRWLGNNRAKQQTNNQQCPCSNQVRIGSILLGRNEGRKTESQPGLKNSYWWIYQLLSIYPPIYVSHVYMKTNISATSGYMTSNYYNYSWGCNHQWWPTIVVEHDSWVHWPTLMLAPGANRSSACK